MTRKYLNDKYCVRCGRHCVTPYLRDNYKHLVNIANPQKQTVIDVGCGNGRNSKFMREQGHKVWSFDMVADYEHGIEMELGKDSFTIGEKADIILCNYVLMFLNKKERKQVIRDIKRVAAPGCTIMVQLYEAKDSFAPTKEAKIEMQQEIFAALGWEKIRYSQQGFIARK